MLLSAERLKSCLNAPERQQGSHSCHYTSGAPRRWSVKPTCARGSSPLLCVTIQPFTRITGTSSGRQSLKLFGITPKYPIHQGNSVWCLRALHTCNYSNPQNCTRRYLQAQKCWHKIRGHFLKPVPKFWWYTIWGVVILKWICGKQLKISRHPICV